MTYVWFDFEKGHLDYVGIGKNQLTILFLHVQLKKGLRRHVLSIFKMLYTYF